MNRFLALTALAALAAGASATQLWYVEDTSDTLRWVDTNTLAVTTVGSLGVDGSFGDMTYDGTNNTMYYIGGRGLNNLYSLNLSTGAATLIGSHGVNDMFALGVTASGQLFAQSTDNNVYSINKLTGAAASIGTNSIYPGGYTYDSVGNRMILQGAGDGHIHEVNLTNGSATLLSTQAFMNDGDIAFDAAGNQYFAMDWSGNLFHYTSGFTRSTLGGGFGEVASTAVVPEPATLTICAIGVAALIRRRRKS